MSLQKSCMEWQLFLYTVSFKNIIIYVVDTIIDLGVTMTYFLRIFN